MNKITPIFCLLAIAFFPAFAKQLSPDEALSRLRSSQNPKALKAMSSISTSPLRVVTPGADPTFTGLYLFKAPDKGVLIVSADDCAAPLLGYTDSDLPAGESFSPEFNYWLQFYADEILAASKRNVKYAGVSNRTKRSPRFAVAPLVKTKWNQSEPFNNDCPMDGEVRSVTGCVATAMAQVMKFHQWPSRGTGSNSYEWRGEELYCDFSNVTFSWNEMLDEYIKDYSDKSAEEVAKLMYACGVAANMDYSSSGSGAYTSDMAKALVDFFNYDPGCKMLRRQFYTTTEWEDEIYRQLTLGLPILYGGQSKGGGHQFVCDGYNDGLFHINWGWGGYYDGYFLLSALDPDDQGIGGSVGNYGYEYSQDALIDLKPASGNSNLTPLVYNFGNDFVYTYDSEDGQFYYTYDRTIPIDEILYFWAGSGFYNYSPIEMNLKFGVKLVSETSGLKFYGEGNSSQLPPFYGIWYYSFLLPQNLENGTYILTPCVRIPGGDWFDIRSDVISYSKFKINVNNGYVTIEDYFEHNMTYNGFELETPLAFGGDFTCQFGISNHDDRETQLDLYLVLSDEEETYLVWADFPAMVYLDPNEEKTVTYSSALPRYRTVYTSDNKVVWEPLEAGKYKLSLRMGNGIIFKLLPELFDVTVAEENAVMVVGADDDLKVSFNGDKIEVSSPSKLSCVEIVSPEGLVTARYETDGESLISVPSVTENGPFCILVVTKSDGSRVVRKLVR